MCSASARRCFAIYGGLDDRINQNIPAIERRWASTARPSARSSTLNVDTLSTTIPARATTPPQRRPRGARALAWFGKYLA